MAGEVLQGLSGGAAGDEGVILRLLGLGQFTLRVGIEVGAVATENVKDEHLGLEARLADLCGVELGFELNDGGLERLAELHEFIVRRVSPQVRPTFTKIGMRAATQGRYALTVSAFSFSDWK
jgi:hypothetical protein